MDFAMFNKIATDSCSEDGVAARFYDRVVKTGEIDANGLPKFRLTCFCEIRIKDNTSEVYDQPATAEKIRRFPAEYARYRMAKKQAPEGTPLEQFAFLDRAEVESLKIRGIFTVEALAELADDKACQLGVEKEKHLAESFLRQAKNNRLLQEWQQKEEEYRAKISYLEEENAALKQAAAAAGKNRRERKKK